MLLCILLTTAPIAPMTPEEGCKLELQQIQKQIDKLEVERNEHAARAAEYQYQGDHWQYNSGVFDDAQKAWNKADDERLQAQDLDGQIQALEAHKQRILQIYPQLGNWGN